MGSKTGRHTDLLIMAKQLGDQGSLSKDLWEREGAVHRRAKPRLGCSGLFPALCGFCFQVLLGFLRGGKLASESSLPRLALLRTCSLHSSWHRGALPTSFSPGQAAQSETQVRDGTQDTPWTVCNFRAPMQLKAFNLVGVKFWGKSEDPGVEEILGWERSSG